MLPRIKCHCVPHRVVGRLWCAPPPIHRGRPLRSVTTTVYVCCGSGVGSWDVVRKKAKKRSSTPFCLSPLFTIDGLLRDLKMVRSVVSRRLSLLSRRSSFHGTSSSSRPLITPRVLSSSTVSLDRYSVCNRFARFHDNAGGGFPLNASVNHQQSQRWFSAEPAHNDDKPTADDSLGIATGLEREELKAKQEGRVLFDLEPPRGPFGTKDAPATVESVFDERLVGCCGGPGEDEHDVIWFNLKKEENFECPICSQYFQLKVVGPGGMPGDHHHH